MYKYLAQVWQYHNSLQFLTTYKTRKGVGARRGRLLLINKKQTSQQPRNALIYSASKKVEKHGKTHLLKRKLQTWKYIIFINRAVFCTRQCAYLCFPQLCFCGMMPLVTPCPFSSLCCLLIYSQLEEPKKEREESFKSEREYCGKDVQVTGSKQRKWRKET